LGGIEELAGERVDLYEIYDRISRVPRLNIDRFRVAVAYELANSRTDDMYRTCLAVVLFFYQVVSAFIARVGGNASSPPGGRIGISMFLTYILPAILLSNLLGNFTSASTCYGIFQKNLPARTQLLSLIDPDPEPRYHGNTTEYFEARPWSGGIYTFRPKKKLFGNDLPGIRPLKFLFLLAILPVFISTSVGMAIIWHLPPTGVNCRWFVLLGISFLYFTSTSITYFSHRGRFGIQGRWHWRITISKDIFIAFSTLALLFASSSGLFNTCWCWSGVMMHLNNKKKASVGLNTDLSFRPYIITLYPALFGICLALQMFTFVGMFLNGWKGLTLMRWSRKIMATRIPEPLELVAEKPPPPPPAPEPAGEDTVQEGPPGPPVQGDLPAVPITQSSASRTNTPEQLYVSTSTVSPTLETQQQDDGWRTESHTELQPLAAAHQGGNGIMR
jgi:hypothetical protein